MKRIFQFLSRRWLPFWVAFNVLIAGIAVFTGFGGDIDPEKMPFAGLALLSFPVWYILTWLMLILNLLLCRPLAPVNLLGLLIALKPFLVFCPLNFGSHELTAEEEPRAFKILSYNILSFVDNVESNPDYNNTMHEVLASGADVLALFEYENQGPLSRFVPQTQIDSLKALYPYYQRGGRGTVMYSKRPILHIQPPENLPSKGSIEAFRTQVCHRPINVFAVHLESFGLNHEDKEMYKKLTENSPKRSEINAMRGLILDKIYHAFRNRGYQALILRQYADVLGGNTVICGDFNDVGGCRVIKVLEEAGFTDVYTSIGLGPTVTFNDPYFYFRIDHVLYRGQLKAIDIERGNVASSDHYPLLTTFVWDEDVPTINY